MQDFGTLPISLLTITLLIVPGLLALELYYRFSERSTTLSRIQWVVYSVFTSLSSLFLLYMLTFVYLDAVKNGSENIASTLGIVSVQELSGLTVPTFVSLYLLHIFLAMALGAGVGRWKKSEYEDRREPWHYAFDETQQDGEELEVITEDGTIIQGEYNQSAWDDSKRELFLYNPYEIIYSTDGSQREKKIDLGRSIIIMEKSISRVLFIKEDPNQERVSQLSEQKEAEERTDFADETPQTISTEVPGGLTEFLEEFFGEQTELSEFMAGEDRDDDEESVENGTSEAEIEESVDDLVSKEDSTAER